MAKDGKAGDAKNDAYLHWYWDDDGYLVIVGRFPPEEGAIFIEALNAARAALSGDADKDHPAADDSAAESPASPADHSDPRDSAESQAASSEHADPDDSAKWQTSDHTDPDDSAESPMSSGGATEHPAEATVPDDSAESGWPTPEDDSAESRGAYEDDDYLNGYWIVPEDEDSGELVWMSGEVPEHGDPAEGAYAGPSGSATGSAAFPAAPSAASSTATTSTTGHRVAKRRSSRGGGG